MTKERETLKMALETLEKVRYRSLADKFVDPAIAAIKEALAQPEQGPVAMQDSAGNSWGTEAHFQAFADRIRADAMEAATRAANESWSFMCKKMVEFEREACAKVVDHMASRCNDIRAAALESAAENIKARATK